VGIVHLGSIAAVMEPGASSVVQLVRDARDRALVTYDPNVRPVLLPDRDDTRRRAERLVALADVVKASDEDLAWLYPDRDPADSARAWQRTGPAVVVVTRGGDGATAVTDAGEVQVRSPRVDVVDSVGAGDTFMGAMIDALVRLRCDSAAARARLRALSAGEVRGVLEHAARAAAVTVSRPGADPPRRGELPPVLVAEA
jgi:fructokinase